MVQAVSTTVFWGGDLKDEEIEALSSQDSSIPASELRSRLREIDKHATKLTALLGGSDLYFDEFFSHRRPNDISQPPTKIGQEAEHRIELELIHLDIRFRKQHGYDPKFSSINQMTTAWELAQIARAARTAVSALKGSGGRPKSGAERLVLGLFEALELAGVRPTCGYSDAEGSYCGSFLDVIPWLHGLPLPVRESANTLCKYAAAIPKQGRNRRKK